MGYVPEIHVSIKSELWHIGDSVRRTFLVRLGNDPRDSVCEGYKPMIRVFATPDHGDAESVLRTLRDMPQAVLEALYSTHAESGKDIPL